MSSELAAKECVPCKGGVPPLKGDELTALQERLGGGWRVVDEHHLEKEYRFPDFRAALDFTNTTTMTVWHVYEEEKKKVNGLR